MAITTIVNTDTFNTWLVRTNQLITGQNNLETSNAVLAYANAVYANAVAVFSISQSNTARTHANSAFSAANAAFANANTTHTSLVANWGSTNAAFLAANSAFANANITHTLTIASFANGNTNFGTTVAAFAKANAALPNVSGATFAGTIKFTGLVNASVFSTNTLVSNANTSVARLATGAEFRTGTSRNLALGVADVWDSAAEVSLTDGTTISIDLAGGFNFNVNLVSQTTRTLATPTNMKQGQSGYIRIKQGGAVAQTMVYGTGWNFAGGSTPTLSTGLGNTDLLFYQVLSTANVFGSLVKDIRLNY